MLHNSLFSSYGEKKKLRVTDVLDKKDKTELLYDKRMTTVLTCMEYDEALKNNAVDQGLKNKMLSLINEAYNGFFKSIDTEKYDHIQIHNNISWITQQGNEYNLLKAFEIICIQLAALKSQTQPPKGKFSESMTDYCNNILKLSLINNDIEKMHEESRRLLFSGAKNINIPELIIPVYTPDSSMGFNTTLFCIFNGYNPVGVGERPYPVHANMYEDNSSMLLAHDYVHTLFIGALKEHDEKLFDSYKKIYFDLFNKKMEKPNTIDDITFKKDLLILFLLVYDLAYSPNKERNGIINIIEKMLTINVQNPNDIDTEKLKELNTSVAGLCDFIKPLQNLGYKIHYDKERIFESADDLRNALIDAIKGFSERHPEIEATLNYQPEKYGRL